MVVPFSGLMVTDAPSLPSAPFGPVKPIEPSFPLIATAAVSAQIYLHKPVFLFA